MRYKHMKMRLVLSSLLAVLALSAVGASAAQASSEGPFYKIAGTRLASGKSKEITVTQYGNYTMSFSSVVITCTKMSASSGSKILGAATGKPGTIEATFTFSGCSVSGNGASCNVSKGEIKTQPLVGTLAYNENKTDLDVLFKKSTKKLFAELNFTGTGCVFTELGIDGQVAAELWAGEKEEWIPVNHEPAEAHTVGLRFAPGIHAVYEDGTGEVEVEELTVDGTGFQLTGASTLELASGELWGVFT
jgi:hypothetical protein